MGTQGDDARELSVAFLLLHRGLEVAARCALGDGLTRHDVSEVLRSLAYAIETQDVAEDMSAISVPME